MHALLCGAAMVAAAWPGWQVLPWPRCADATCPHALCVGQWLMQELDRFMVHGCVPMLTPQLALPRSVAMCCNGRRYSVAVSLCGPSASCILQCKHHTNNAAGMLTVSVGHARCCCCGRSASERGSRFASRCTERTDALWHVQALVTLMC